MKKGFTILEIVTVLAIITILLGISIPNLVRLNANARLDESTNTIASILKEAYENADKEADFDKYFVEINNFYSKESHKDETFLIVRLKDNNKTIKEFRSKSIKLYENTTDNFKDGVYNLKYNSSGSIVLENESSTFNEEMEQISIDIVEKDKPSNKKTITIKSLPPGNVLVK